MQPHNEEQRGASIFLIQVVLAGIGFVFVILLFATVFVRSNGSVDDVQPSFAAVAADSPPIPIAPTTAAPPTTVLTRNVGEGDAEDSTTAPATISTSSTASTTTSAIPNGRPVPDVTELEINDAILVIFDWELEIVRLNEASDDIPAGFVIRTDPAPRTEVEPGSPITLVVSTGPE